MNVVITWLFVAFAIVAGFFSPGVSAQQNPLTISPVNIWSRPSQEHRFNLSGGLPPIRWQSKSGEVSAVDGEEGVYLYRAPRRYMQDQVHFFDNAGQQAMITIDVLRPLTVSPSVRRIPIGGVTDFVIQGGSGEWKFSEETKLKLNKQENGKLQVVAGSNAGQYTLKVMDMVTDDEVELMVHVYAPLQIQHVPPCEKSLLHKMLKYFCRLTYKTDSKCSVLYG